MASLPMELITSILTRLPTKSLLRFKCVSKAWNSLISSTHLIGLHLAHSLSSDRRLLILNYGSHLESTPLKWGYELDVDNDLMRFDLPSSFSGFEVSICGCCNGLIALVCRNVDDPRLFKFILWNPSMNSYFVLPCIPVVGDLSSEFMGVSFGFGYDCGNDDYKIVRIVDYFHHRDDSSSGGGSDNDVDFDVNGGGTDLAEDEDGSDGDNEDDGGGVDVDGDNDADGSDGDSSDECSIGFIYKEVMVYSLKENCWKMIHVAYFGDEMKWFCSGAVLNNCIVHWIFWKYRKREPRLRGFDLSSFKWTKLALPDFRGKEKIDCSDDDDTLSKAEFESSDIVALGVLDECLSIVTRFCPEFDNAYVWVMKEYGVEDSWTKLFNVTEASLVGPLLSSPLASFKGGDEVLLRKADEDGLCWYDLRRKSIKAERNIPSSLKLRDVKLCVESLVPVPEVIDGSDEGS
ncbi:F-box protein At4g22390-like [Chenopodium quinoa]|uniref:F-box protein At4g22390-like n=1 Tax=Chenopodium quinoa TaxID=63459 RepID=UPI000B79194D|nr:F-box protein At4g22390-like [Chenopodium quinoa]